MNRQALAFVCGFAANKSPVLAMCAVRITEAFLYATNGTSSMRLTWQGPAGLDVSVLASRLLAVLGGLADDQEIKLKKLEGNAISLIAGSRKFKLATIPGDQPEIEVKGELNFEPVEELADGMKFASVSADKKQTVKPHQNAVLVDRGADGTSVVGLDGYRMSVAKVSDTTGDSRSLVPLALAQRVIALAKDGGDIAFTADRLVYRNEKGAEFIGVLMGSGQFPPWRRIMNPDESKMLEIGGSQANIHTAASDATRLGVHPIVLNAKNGTLTVTGASKSGEQIDHEIAIDQPAGEISLALNPQYLDDAIGAFKEWPRILLPSASSGLPAVLRHKNKLAIVQAMKA